MLTSWRPLYEERRWKHVGRASGEAVDVVPTCEVAALDQQRVTPCEIALGALVAGRGLDHGLPVVAAEEHRVSRPALVRRPGEHVRLSGLREHASYDCGIHVGQVDQGHQRRVGLPIE